MNKQKINQFREEALIKIQQGKEEFENNFDFETKKMGFENFKIGVLMLLKYANHETNHQIREQIRKKMEEYLGSLENMKFNLKNIKNNLQQNKQNEIDQTYPNIQQLSNNKPSNFDYPIASEFQQNQNQQQFLSFQNQKEKYTQNSQINKQNSSFDAMLQSQLLRKQVVLLNDVAQSLDPLKHKKMIQILNNYSEQKLTRKQLIQELLQYNQMKKSEETEFLLQVIQDLSGNPTSTQQQVQQQHFEDENPQILQSLFTQSINKQLNFAIFDFTKINSQEQNYYKNVMRTLRNLDKQGQLKNDGFIDDQFRANQSSIQKILKDNKEIVFYRPKQFLKGEIQMFGKLNENSVKQGELGDCYFLSTVAALTKTAPFQLKKLFYSQEVNKYGCYSIWLCISGVWQNIIIDDLIPYLPKCRSIAFASSENNEIWVMLLEKAYAKCFGSYSAIEKGSPTEAMSVLTGAPCETIDTNKEETKNESWTKIQHSFQKGFILTASSANDVDQVGLISSHCYTIIDILQCNSSQGLFRRIKLRNPWSKNDCKLQCIWNEELKSSLGIQIEKIKEEKGSFWIEYTTFCQYFEDVCICKLQQNFKYAFVKEEFDNSLNGSLIQFKLAKSSKIFISVNQLQKRHFQNNLSNYDYSKIRLVLLKQSNNQILKQKIRKKQQVTLEIELGEGIYYIYAKIDWNINIQMKKPTYSISTYCNELLQLQKVSNMNPTHWLEQIEKDNISFLFNSYCKDPKKQGKIKQKITSDDKGQQILIQTSGKAYNYVFQTFSNVSPDYQFEITVNYDKFEGLQYDPIFKQFNNIALVLLPGQSVSLALLIISDYGGYEYSSKYQMVYQKII